MFNKRLVSSIALVLLLILSLITTSVAWFASVIEAHTEGEFEASSIVSYFAGGEGTETDPYIVMTPKHLYNLSWLQNQGAFTGKKFYFQVSDLEGNPVTIDMAGMIYGSDSEHKTGAIPPIGTKEQPFEGYFNGCGSVIKNLWVSTRKADWKEQPEGAGDYSSKYVGLFGAIGGEAIIENFILDTVEVTTHVNEAKVGIICGYVNAMVRNVGVYNGIISVVDGAVCTSNYSLLGEKDARIVWDDMPKVDSQYEDTTSGSSGWGGSISMLDLNKRLTYISALNMQARNTSYAFPSNNTNYNLNIWMGYNSPGYSPPDYIYPKTNYIMGGTVLPLNVDTTTMFKTPIANYTSSNGVSGTLTTEYYSSNTSELVDSKNTGYIAVNTGTSTSTSAIRARIYQIDGLYKSFNKSSASTTGATKYENIKSNLILLGLNSSGQFVQIKDSYNSVTGGAFAPGASANKYIGTYASVDADTTYKNYTKVRKAIDEMFSESNFDAYTTIHGIRFYKGIDGTNLMAAPSGASMGGAPVNNLVSNSINFTVDKPGLITAVAGSYSSSGSQSLFDIYQVTRSGGSISAVTKISKIYVEKANENNICYVYEGSSDTYAGNNSYTLKYDASWLNSKIPSYTLSYYEIPVKAGEYAIGAVNSAYLMYLDIGSNGGESTTVQRPTNPGEFAAIMYDVDYVISTDVDISADSYVNHPSLLRIDTASSGSKIYYLAAGVLNESTVYYCTGGSTITDIAAQTPKKSAPKNKDDTFEGTSFSDRTETK